MKGPAVTMRAAVAAALTTIALVTSAAVAIPATISFRSDGTGSTSSASDHVTVSMPTGILAGDLLIAQIAVRGGSTTTITPPAGWSLILRTNSGGSIAQAICR